MGFGHAVTPGSRRRFHTACFVLALGACEISCELASPGPFATRMDLYPSVTLPFAQLEGACASWDVQMPVVASRTTCELAMTCDHESVAPALR